MAVHPLYSVSLRPEMFRPIVHWEEELTYVRRTTSAQLAAVNWGSVPVRVAAQTHANLAPAYTDSFFVKPYMEPHPDNPNQNPYSIYEMADWIEYSSDARDHGFATELWSFSLLLQWLIPRLAQEFQHYQDFVQAVLSKYADDTWITSRLHVTASSYANDTYSHYAEIVPAYRGQTHFPIFQEAAAPGGDPVIEVSASIGVCDSRIQAPMEMQKITFEEYLETGIAYYDEEPPSIYAMPRTSASLRLTNIPEASIPPAYRRTWIIGGVARNILEVEPCSWDPAGGYVESINPTGYIQDIHDQLYDLSAQCDAYALSTGGTVTTPTFTSVAPYYEDRTPTALTIAPDVWINQWFPGQSADILARTTYQQRGHIGTGIGHVGTYISPISGNYVPIDGKGGPACEFSPMSFSQTVWRDHPIPWDHNDPFFDGKVPFHANFMNWAGGLAFLEDYIRSPDDRFDGCYFNYYIQTAEVTRFWYGGIGNPSALDYVGELHVQYFQQIGWIDSATGEKTLGTNPSLCSIPAVDYPPSGWLTPDIVGRDDGPFANYPWTDAEWGFGGGSFYLQDGSAEPLYPTFTGAYVYDTHLQKWGKFVADHKGLIDYKAVNKYIAGEQSFGRFGVSGGCFTEDGMLHIFDTLPENSWVTYGKIGYSRQGMTTVEEVRVHHRIPVSGTIAVETSLEGKNLNVELVSASDYIGSNQWQHNGGFSGRWHNVKVSGQFDISYLEFRGIIQGKR